MVFVASVRRAPGLLVALSVTAFCSTVRVHAATPLPAPVRAMIETALRDDDPVVVAAVLNTARKAFPDSSPEIKAFEADYKSRAALMKSAKLRAARERLAAASPLSLWNGDMEVGGSRSTGSSTDADYYAAAKLHRDGLHWNQTLSARAEYAESDHVQSTERIAATYQPQYKFSASRFAYGLAGYEHDKFLGYGDRYTIGVGLGLTLLDRPGLKVSVDTGPAVRYARYYGQAGAGQLADRTSVSAKWEFLPDLTLSEEAAAYFDRLHATTRSTLALGAKVLGPLQARVSYDVQFERDAPTAHRESDAVTRASLVYKF